MSKIIGKILGKLMREKANNMGDISLNFNKHEFSCKCGCGKNKPIDSELIRLLQNLRTKLTKPIHILEGVRCNKYNKEIKGFIDSPHLQGKAVDCKVKNISLIDLAREARDIGFSRVGLYKTFLHLDIIEPYPSASWYRDEKGIYHYFKTLEKTIEYLKK